MKKELPAIFLLLLFTFPAIRSLFIPGGFTAHDLTHHVVRQISMDKLLSEGQFPPRWSGELNKGYGYPVFLFNYPLPALVGELFHKLGFNFLYSVKAVLFLSMILSPLGMYLFLRSYLGTSLPAFLGAMFYLYAPHRFLNVYVSAAVGSALGDAILPFVFLSMVQVKKCQMSKVKCQTWVILGGLFLAALILSHNITTLIFFPLILAFVSLLIWESKDRTILLKRFVIMFLLGLGLSAWFWLPALTEKQYIKFDAVFGKFYESQFPTLKQLIRSPWGFGLSHPQNPEAGDLSYQIGLIHILAMILLFWAVLIFKQLKRIGLFMLAFFFFSVFLILKLSKFVWDFVPFMNMAQFPLRFSAVAVFTASVGVSLLVKYLPYRKVIFLTLLILVIYANRNHWKINEVFDPGEDYYLSLKTTSASFDEHLPKWAKAMKKEPESKLEFAQGGGKVNILKDQSALVSAEVEATGSAKLKLNQFYFPGWEIKVDGKKTDFSYLLDGENYGLILFDIGEGKHKVLAEFKNTLDRNIADGISIITVIIIILNLWKLLPRTLSKAKKSF